MVFGVYSVDGLICCVGDASGDRVGESNEGVSELQSQLVEYCIDTYLDDLN